jgi:PTH1 family peptidyl-tRNA hydrolase
MKLVVGLGNPGKKYEKTRHNVGFLVLDALQEKLKDEAIGAWEYSKKFQAEIAGCTVRNEKIILVKPQTFMNESGVSVAALANFYKIQSTDIIVVHDDKDIPLGEIKVQQDRGSAGHNGIKSIIEHIGTQNFFRIRVGVANENTAKIENIADFVLSKFGLFEKGKLKLKIQHAIDEILKLI